MCEPWVGFWGEFGPPVPPTPDSLTIHWFRVTGDPGFAPMTPTLTVIVNGGAPHIVPIDTVQEFAFGESCHVAFVLTPGMALSGAGETFAAALSFTGPDTMKAGSFAQTILTAQLTGALCFDFIEILEGASPLYGNPQAGVIANNEDGSPTVYNQNLTGEALIPATGMSFQLFPPTGGFSACTPLFSEGSCVYNILV